MPLSLLRPWPGRRLPHELRPGPVAQLAAAFPGGLRDPQLEALLTRIETGRFHRPTRVEVFFEGHATFRAAFAAIDAAGHEVLLESYIIRDDSTGRAALEALARAAARGVVVKVLVDAWGSWATRSAFWEEMQRHGIAVRFFHPLWTHWRHRSNRDHRKILVVDRQVAFLGGMNVADEYGSSWRPTDKGSSDENWRDTHARLEGSVARELAAVFQEGWTRAGGKPFDLGPEPEPPADAAGARALVVETRAGRGQREKASLLAAVVGGARERVLITNAYFAPGRGTVGPLGDAARRGVDVRLLLPGRSDVALLRHAGHAYYESLLKRGVRVFEYQPQVLHAKTLVADGYISLIGSSNLDARSFRFNAECNVLVLDEATGQCMTAAFERDLAQSEEVLLPEWRRRAALHRWADRGARLFTPVL
jgi:cardiolipin synthase